MSRERWLAAIFAICLVIGVARLCQAQPASLLGSQAPRIRASGALGESIDVPAKGKVTVLIFWNSRYRVSADALGAVQRILNSSESRDLVCVGINDLGEDQSTVKQVADQLRVAFPLAGGTACSKAAAAYKVKGVPVVFLIDRSGTIVYVKEGWDRNTASDVESQLGYIL